MISEAPEMYLQHQGLPIPIWLNRTIMSIVMTAETHVQKGASAKRGFFAGLQFDLLPIVVVQWLQCYLHHVVIESGADR